MRLVLLAIATATALSVTAAPAAAQRSSAQKATDRKMRQMPHCSRVLGTISIVEPDNQWWREFNLGSPEAILKVFVQESGCFRLVNRGRAMQSRAMERALAEQGELQSGSAMGKGQVKAADYFLEPNLVQGNRNSGGANVGGLIGGLIGGRTGAAIGGAINIKKKEASVTLSMVDARTTEEWVTQGYARKTDIGFGAGGGAGWWGGFAAAGGSSYQNTEIGQVIVLAYLDAYTKMVRELGGI